MVQPESLKSEEYQPWSRGRGVDVWAMICAAITGDLDTIKRLAAADPNLIDCEYEYFKPIRFAVRENQRAAVDFLLENGADPAYEAGESLLQIARERGYAELAALIEQRLRDRYEIVPEMAVVVAAIKARDENQAQALLEKQPELIRAADERGNQPLHWAVMTRQIGLIDHLLERGADINAKRPDGLRPIHLTNGDYHYRGWRDVPPTALQKQEILVGYLLARGADYDLSTATKLGDLDRVRALLDENPALVNEVPALAWSGSRCCTSTKPMPVSSGKCLSNSVNASNPPADAPTPTIRKEECDNGFATMGQTLFSRDRDYQPSMRSLPADSPMERVLFLWRQFANERPGHFGDFTCIISYFEKASQLFIGLDPHGDGHRGYPVCFSN